MSALPVARGFLESFCVRNRIRKLSLFGSVLTPRFGPDSDVDVLVEFEPGAPVSYFDLVGMEMELSEVIGRKVDLRTPEELSRYFRDKVVAAALPSMNETDRVRLQHMLDATREALSFVEGRTLDDLKRDRKESMALAGEDPGPLKFARRPSPSLRRCQADQSCKL